MYPRVCTERIIFPLSLFLSRPLMTKELIKSNSPSLGLGLNSWTPEKHSSAAQITHPFFSEIFFSLFSLGFYLLAHTRFYYFFCRARCLYRIRGVASARTSQYILLLRIVLTWRAAIRAGKSAFSEQILSGRGEGINAKEKKSTFSPLSAIRTCGKIDFFETYRNRRRYLFLIYVLYIFFSYQLLSYVKKRLGCE